MGSLNGRIGKLEGLVGRPEEAAYNAEREAIIAELEELEEKRRKRLREETPEERAEREAREHDPNRLAAWRDLEEQVERYWAGRAGA